MKCLIYLNLLRLIHALTGFQDGSGQHLLTAEQDSNTEPQSDASGVGGAAPGMAGVPCDLAPSDLL